MNGERGNTVKVALTAMAALMLLVMCAAVSGVGVYLWQSSIVGKLNQQLTAAEARERALETEVDLLNSKLEELTLAKPKKPSGSTSGGTSGGGAKPPATTTGTATEPQNGKVFGFIRDVIKSGGVYYVYTDLALFLTGPKAVQAAAKDGFIKPGEPLDNDYYIQNNNKKVRTYPIAAGALISLAGPTKSITLGGLFSLMHGTDSYSKQHAGAPYWITLKNGRVMEIKEQYVP